MPAKRVNHAPKASSSKSAKRSKAIVQRDIGVGTGFTYQLSPLPADHFCTLRYAETFSFTTGAAGVLGTEQLMLLNSLFDPNSTGTGHQPYGFDQIKTFYAKYQVTSCFVTILANTIGSSAEVCVATSIMLPNAFQSLTSLSVDRATELPNVSTKTLSSSGNNRAIRMEYQFNMAKLLGISGAMYRDDDKYQALVSASPALSPSLGVAIGSYSGTAAEAASIQIIMDFKCRFFERFTMSQS